MTDQPAWYPPSQVCYPPELPIYLKNVHDLKPIVGVPSNDEVVGIHAVIQAATRVSGIIGMHDPDLFMKLADHLFSVQMLIYRNKYASSVFPTDVIYTPPVLPAHVPVNLGPISCAPSDEEVTKIQDAIRMYQKYSEIPSLFEPGLSAELSQHLFDVQMARFMYRAAQYRSSPNPHATTQSRNLTGTVINTAESNDTHDAPNNGGTGAAVMESYQLQNVGIRDILERSNLLAERANQLAERSNELIERSNQIVEQTSRSIEQPEHPVEKSYQLTEQSDINNHSERPKEPLGGLNQHAMGSNQLTEGPMSPVEQLGDILRTINKVLVAIQHAIVRNCKDNSTYAIRALVNEKGDLPMGSSWMWPMRLDDNKLNFRVGSRDTNWYISDDEIVYYLRFYGIEGDYFEDSEKTRLLAGKRDDARKSLGQYLTSILIS